MISLGTSSIDDSARTSVSTNAPYPVETCPAQVMRFMARSANRRNYGNTRTAVASIARERIEILITKAREMVEKDPELSRRYVCLARKISERTKVRIPGDLKRFLCKSCGIAMVPGTNARVRLRARGVGVAITCLTCGTVKRYPVSRRIGARSEPPAMKTYIVQSELSAKKNSSKN
jgi:ribonuclease P protein subunit RPR2